jgi:hypothetical protein
VELLVGGTQAGVAAGVTSVGGRVGAGDEVGAMAAATGGATGRGAGLTGAAGPGGGRCASLGFDHFAGKGVGAAVGGEATTGSSASRSSSPSSANSGMAIGVRQLGQGTFRPAPRSGALKRRPQPPHTTAIGMITPQHGRARTKGRIMNGWHNRVQYPAVPGTAPQCYSEFARCCWCCGRGPGRTWG